MFYVDLNSDLGESFGNYTIGMDEEILQYVSSANVACGWHAGDPMVMDKTIALAKKIRNRSRSTSGISGSDGLRSKKHGGNSGRSESISEIPARRIERIY